MKVSLIGSNGTMATAFGKYCNLKQYELHVYGRTKPAMYDCCFLHEVDLLKDTLAFPDLFDSNIVVYAAGAGIQFSKNDRVESIYKLNVETPVSLYNRLREHSSSAKLITFGSYFEIGANVEDKQFTEEEVLSSCFSVPNDYCVSKRMLTRFFSSVSNDVNFCHFILPTIYSEHEDRNRLIPYCLDSIKNGRALSFTSGEQIRQYLYVDDVPKNVFSALNNQLPNGIYNIEGTETLTVKSLVCMLLKNKGIQPDDNMFGTNLRQDVGMRNLQLDGSKLKKMVDWEPCNTILSVLNKY